MALVAGLAGVVAADPAATLLQGGSYEVRVRLELPNVRWTADRTAIICVADAEAGRVAPLTVLSANNPLARCPAANVEQHGATLSFDILCEGRDAARARAVYELEPDAFEGRIAMVMGGKNMTMTEVQSGRRVGRCD